MKTFIRNVKVLAKGNLMDADGNYYRKSISDDYDSFYCDEDLGIYLCIQTSHQARKGVCTLMRL